MIHRLSLAALRLIARLVPRVDRATWLREWEAELRSRRTRLTARNALTRYQEFDMFRRVLGSFHDAAWLRRQFTRDADLVHDMRYGARLLRRNPGFALLTVSVLALGMGATTGIFSVVDALLVRQLPYRDPERIVLLFEAPTANPAATDGVSPANFLDWRSQVQSIEYLAAAEPFGYTLGSGDEAQSVSATRVSSGFFESFGMNALHGRTFTPEEYSPGRDQVAVLSHAAWIERFGGDRDIVGRGIRLSGRPYTVVGVMPPEFAPRLLVTFRERGFWTPKVWGEIEQRIRGARYYNAVARLKPGVTVQQAQAELDGIAQRLAQQYPRTNSDHRIQIVSLRDHLAGDLRPSIGLLSGAVVLLLLIAMANTANLLMARASARVREMAVRNAIGADGTRLVRQLLAETLTLAALRMPARVFRRVWHGPYHRLAGAVRHHWSRCGWRKWTSAALLGRVDMRRRLPRGCGARLESERVAILRVAHRSCERRCQSRAETARSSVLRRGRVGPCAHTARGRRTAAAELLATVADEPWVLARGRCRGSDLHAASGWHPSTAHRAAS